MESPEIVFVDTIFDLVSETWEKAVGELPEEGSTSFAVACWRIAMHLTEFEPPLCPTAVAVVCHARTWANRRQHWKPAPLFLCDHTKPGGRHLFWLISRDEAAKNGEDLDGRE